MERASVGLAFGKLGWAGRLGIVCDFLEDSVNLDAVFSDETAHYVSNPEAAVGEKIRVRLRCGVSDFSRVVLVTNGLDIDMVLCKSDDVFEWYEAFITVREITRYYFRLENKYRQYFYNKRGIYDWVDENYNFRLIPGFSTPEWAKGAVMYQIYVDRFYNGDTSNDVLDNEYTYLGMPARQIKNFNQEVAVSDVCNFYGGDLRGVIDKLPYLNSLGVSVIYLNPIFVSPSNHKYDIQDYDYIDPHYGVIVNDDGEVLSIEKFNNRYATKYMSRTTDPANLEASNLLFAELVSRAHDMGIRVILDGVFNHCGAFNKWLDREGFYGQNGYPLGAYRDEHSVYHDYFRWFDRNWPYNDAYDAWWGYDNHPKLNFEGSRALFNSIMAVGKKWVSPPYSADGWRLDVAADLGVSREFNHHFWREFRKAVKAANPEGIILAEHYGDPSEWMKGDEWDTVMNYDAFMEPVTWFLTGMEKHSEAFRGDLLNNPRAFIDAMRYHMSRMSYQSLYTAMNQLSNHDHSRFMTRTNMTVGRLHTKGSYSANQNVNRGIFMEAVILQMCWPGSPTLYYGDEAGLCGWTDPDNRRSYPWGFEDDMLVDFHREIIGIHNQSPALKLGSLEYLVADYGLLAFGRFDNTNKVIAAVNNTSEIKELKIPVWRMGIENNAVLRTLISTSLYSFTTENREYTVKNGFIHVWLPAYGGAVISN